MLDQSAEDPNGFYQNFQKFYAQAKDVHNVRFSYMKELYNLGIETFPTNDEICAIQSNNKLSSQAFQTKLKKNWTDDDKRVLIWLVGKVMAMNKRDLKQISETDWVTVSSMMQRRDAFQCKQKWLQMLKLPLQQAPWGVEEDELLRRIIDEFQNSNKGNKWSMIATALNKKSDSNVHRNGKQCRERWNNHLNPQINRNPWQQSEDLDLMKLALTNGKKWALISKKLKIARSENSVKNRFNCLLRKERNAKSKKEEYDIDDDDSKLSNFPSEAEELSHTDIKHIQNIIRKIEWRMQQDGGHKEEEENDSQDNIKQEYQEVKSSRHDTRKKIKKSIEQISTNPKSQESLVNPNQMMLVVKDPHQIPDDEIQRLIPCLVNKEKNILYFASQEQLSQFCVGKPFETIQQPLNQSQALGPMPSHVQYNQEGISNFNSLASFFYNDQKQQPRQVSQYFMLQNSTEFQPSGFNMGTSIQLPMQQSQRAVLNIPGQYQQQPQSHTPTGYPGYNYYQSMPHRMPSMTGFQAYPSQTNLLGFQDQTQRAPAP